MIMRKKEPAPKTPFELWLEEIIVVATQRYGIDLTGCSAYLYKRNAKYACCAMMYGKGPDTWKEIATRRDFTSDELPQALFQKVKGNVSNNITDEFMKVFVKEQKGTEDMKEGTKKAIQTALNIAANGESITEMLRYKKDSSNQMDATSRVAGMARAAINGDWFDLARMGFEAVIDMISDDPLTYTEFLSAVSQYVDAKIMAIASEENLRFVGGECQLIVDEARQVLDTKVQLYFKNQQDKWIKKELNGHTDFETFSAETLDGEISNILIEGGRKFPITDPTKE